MAHGFIRQSGPDLGDKVAKISSLAITIGDLLAFSRSAGTVVKATSSTSAEDIAGVATKDTTTSDTEVTYRPVNADDTYRISTANNSNVSHNYQRMVLTDENEVNNTGTDSTSDAAVFMQEGVYGVAADKEIIGRIITRQDRA